MKKKIWPTLLVLAILGSMVAGCDNNSGTTQTTTPQTTAASEGSGAAASETISGEPVELTVWESMDGPDKWIEDAGVAFNQKYPNITIKFVNVELGDSASQLALDGPAGVGPDLFAAPHDKLGQLVTGGLVMETVEAQAVEKEVLPAAAQALTYEGKMYGYPTSAETYALYYNKDLIAEDQVPKTWSDLATWCKTFNEANSGKYGFVMDVGNIYYTILFTTKDGNRLFGSEGTDTKDSYLTTEAAISGMTEFQKLREVLPLAAADIKTDVADGAFASGTAAMHISGPWNISNFEEAGINFGVTTLPALDGQKDPAASFSGTRGMFVSSFSEHPAEAALFARFLLTDEMQQLRYEITGALPSIDLAVDSVYAQGFIKQLNYAFPMPSVPQMSAFWDAGNAASANIWNGAEVKSEMTAFDQTVMNTVTN